MTTGYWNLHMDMQNVTSTQLIARSSADDDQNRLRSLETFTDEMALVDEGLALYVEAIQSAFKEINRWSDNVGLRSSISMLIHALNSFMAWKNLLTTGYVSEGRLFARNIHEALCQAIAFRDDETLATKFYRGHQIPPKTTRQSLSKVLAEESSDENAVFNQFVQRYKRLSNRAHPTLDSFAFRANIQKVGNDGLREAVPEGVFIGGILSDDLGRIVWRGLARDIAQSLATVGFVLKDATGDWELRYENYQAVVEGRIGENA